jgi:hypothetical protein
VTEEPRPRPISPAEFTRRLPEGWGAGPGAPETDDPRGGRPGAGGHGPQPERPSSLWGDSETESQQHYDELPDVPGIAGTAAYVTGLGVGWLADRVATVSRHLRNH